MDIRTLKKDIEENVEFRKDDLLKLSKDIHSNPELCYKEFKAANWLSGYLEKNNLVVRRAIGNIDTAFKCTYQNGEAKYNIAILAEYDALPVIGHACGHNIICTSAVGAFLAVKYVMDKYDIRGKVSLIGTPAEEGGGGKTRLIEAGEFKDVDCAIMMHPTSGVSRIAGRCLASHSFNIKYKGKSAHAASRPHEGVNALDAANIFFHSVACLRQHVTSDVRMHGVILDGGEIPGMIPDRVSIKYTVRAFENDYIKSIIGRVKNCIKAGAIATGCEFEIEDIPGYKARTFNEVIGEVCKNNLKYLGEEILPGYPDDFGSTDFGDVSRIMPTCNPYITINPVRISSHTEKFRDLSISKSGERAMMISAKAMAMTIIDLIADNNIIEKSLNEFNK